MADLNKIIDELSTLTVVEAAELSKQLEEKWGVTAAAPVAAAPVGGTAAPAASSRTKNSLRNRAASSRCNHPGAMVHRRECTRGDAPSRPDGCILNSPRGFSVSF